MGVLNTIEGIGGWIDKSPAVLRYLVRLLILSALIVGGLVLVGFLGNSYTVNSASGTAAGALKTFGMHNVASLFPTIAEYIPAPNITTSDTLGFLDALQNIFSLVVTSAFAVVFGLSVAIFASIAFLLKGIFAADWKSLLAVPICVIGGGAFLFVPFVLYVSLLFQSGTPAYYLTMLLGLLPLCIGEAVPAYMVIVIIIPIRR